MILRGKLNTENLSLSREFLTLLEVLVLAVPPPLGTFCLRNIVDIQNRMNSISILLIFRNQVEEVEH